MQSTRWRRSALVGLVAGRGNGNAWLWKSEVLEYTGTKEGFYSLLRKADEQYPGQMEFDQPEFSRLNLDEYGLLRKRKEARH